MQEHEHGEVAAAEGETAGRERGADATARAERMVAAAGGDPHAFAVALQGLGEAERGAVVAAAHTLAGNAFVNQAVQALAALPTGPIHTVVDKQALRRNAADLTKTTADAAIAEGTRVRIVSEQTVGRATFVELHSVSGADLGWTAKTNLDVGKPLDQQYANAKAQYVFRAGGKDLMVYLPPKGLTSNAVDVFMFFHGMGGDYTAASGVTNAKSDTDHDNAALAADIPGAIAAAGNTIGICPAGGANPWNDVKPGQYRAMVDETLAHLGEEAGQGPLKVGHVSLAGHSAGGKALGGAAKEVDAAAGLDVTDVTLEDAGYNFDSYQASWNSLRDWFCLGDPTKTLRVISKDPSGGTHGVVEDGHQFAKDSIAALGKQRGVNLTTKPVTGDATVRDGGMTLQGGLDVYRDGALQGKLRVFGIALADAMPGDTAQGKDPVAHWKVRNRSMKAAVLAGPDAEHFGTAAQPGPAHVVHSRAPVLDSELHPIAGKALTQGTAVQVTQHRVDKGVAYAEVEGHGWVQLTYLE